MGDDTDIMTALQLMSDEELQQLLRAGNVPTRSAFVERELQRARQVEPMGDYGTLAGAIGGGFGSLLRQGVGAKKEADLQGQYEKQMKLLEDPNTARLTTGGQSPKTREELLIELLRKRGGAGDGVGVGAGEQKLGLAS
jgi:hypothetical protein